MSLNKHKVAQRSLKKPKKARMNLNDLKSTYMDLNKPKLPKLSQNFNESTTDTPFPEVNNYKLENPKNITIS